MATAYEFHDATGDEHTELSFDVDGRFATYEGLHVTIDDEGVKHLVVSLSVKGNDAPAEEAPVEEAPLEVTTDE